MALVARWKPVRVVGERGRRLRVAELRGDVGDRRTLGEQVSRERVAQVVEPEARQAGRAQDAAERFGDRRRVERRTGARREDPRAGGGNS